jgi:hypothetical protein
MILVKKKSTRKDKQTVNFRDNSAWETAAAEAKAKLAQCKAYAGMLRRSLRIFEEKIRTQAPFP